MGAEHERWLTAQATARILDTTSAEVCRLLSIGRLSGTKSKQSGRAGKAQWLVEPKSIAKEKKFRTKHAREERRRKNAKATPEAEGQSNPS